MNNSALVSFRLKPDRYAVLKALAEGQNESLSELVRETVEEALDLKGRARQLEEYFAGRTGREWTGSNG